MVHPLTLLDALDDMITGTVGAYIVTHNETISEELRGAYWLVVQQIEAWRDLIQPAAIYPEPAPILNCPHPYDRDYCLTFYDPVEEWDFFVRCCRVCGGVGDPQPIWPNKYKTHKRKKEKQRKKRQLDSTPTID